MSTALNVPPDWDENSVFTLFENTPHPHDRRQIIRHLIYFYANRQVQANNAVRYVLKKALKDNDWEVRVSAFIACARYKLMDMAEEIMQSPLKIQPDILPEKKDREIIAGIQKVTLMAIADHQPQAINPNNNKHLRWQHLLKCVSDHTHVSNTRHNDQDFIAHTVHYFSTPAIVDEPQVANACKAIEERDQQFFLRNTDIEMLWIGSDNFYISCWPIYQDGSSEEEQYLSFTSHQIKPYIAQMREQCGIEHLNLPTHAQWLQVATGPDARRYPWGWGLCSDYFLWCSPWGSSGYGTEYGEWVSDGDTLLKTGIKTQRITPNERPESHEEKQHGHIRLLLSA